MPILAIDDNYESQKDSNLNEEKSEDKTNETAEEKPQNLGPQITPEQQGIFDFSF